MMSLPELLVPKTFRWLVPPRGGRPFVGAMHPAVSREDRWLALAQSGRHLVKWRGAGEDVVAIPLPEGAAVRGLALGPERRVAAYGRDEVLSYDGEAWARFECASPKRAVFGDDGALRVLASGELHCVESDGRVRWSTPTDFEDPLVAMGDEVWLVAWGVTQVFAADGTIEERDNDASSTPKDATRVGDKAVAVMVDEDGRRSLLVIGAEGSEVVDIEDEEECWEHRPLAAVGQDAVAIGTQVVKLSGGKPMTYLHGTHSSYGKDAVASDGERLFALRGGGVSAWVLGTERELGERFEAPLGFDVHEDLVAAVLPNTVAVQEASGAVERFRVEVPLAREVRFSKEGTRLFVTSREAPMLRVLDAATGATLATSTTYRPTAVAAVDGGVVVADGLKLVWLGEDMVARGEALAAKNAYGDYLEALAVDGQALVAKDNGGTFHVFREGAFVRSIARGVMQGSTFTLVDGALVVCGDVTTRVGLESTEVEVLEARGSVASRGGPWIWSGAELVSLASGERVPWPLRPDKLIAVDGGVHVLLSEGLGHL